MSAHNVITVPEFKLHPGCRTAFRWSTGNELILFQQPTQNVADNIKLYSKSDPSARKTTVLKISEVVDTQKSKLICESHGVFVHLQERVQQVERQSKKSQRGAHLSRELRAELLQASRHYRALLRAQAHDSTQHRDSTQHDSTHGDSTQHDSTQGDSTQGDSTHAHEVMWHLSELFLLHSRSVAQLVQLQAWLEDYAPILGRVGSRAAAPFSEQDPQYWRLVTGCIVRGLRNQARELLALHPQHGQKNSKYGQLLSFIDLALNTMPVTADMTSFMNTDEFLLRWGQWHEDVVRLLSTHEQQYGHASTTDQLHRVLLLLAGDDAVIEHVTASWSEHVLAQLLFADPQLLLAEDEATCHELSALIDRATRHEHVTDLDHILRAIFKGDVYAVMEEVSHVEDTWLRAHWLDLFDKATLYHVPLTRAYSQQRRDHVLVEYCHVLFDNAEQHPSYWHVIADYCAHVPALGAPTFAAMIERARPGTERQARKLLALCARYEAATGPQTRAIYLAQCHRALAAQCYGSALAWSIELYLAALTQKHAPESRQHAASMMWKIVDQLLGHVIDLHQGADKPVYRRLVALLSSSPLRGLSADELRQCYASAPDQSSLHQLTNQLQPLMSYFNANRHVAALLLFLQLYSQFLSLRQDGDFAAAAQTIVKLVSNNLIPTKFLFKILYEALPLLFLEQPMFSSEDTQTLMQAYQALLTLPHVQDTAHVDNQFHSAVADLFRLGFSRNFANAVTSNV